MEKRHESALEIIDGLQTEIKQIAKTIWELKETGFEEFKSAKLLCDFLEKNGFILTRGLTGQDVQAGCPYEMPTAFIADFDSGKKGPVIGLLLEYDALSNGHACGHNLIAASGIAAAVAIQGFLKTGAGRLRVYGTPAEETSTAKQFIFDGGHMGDVDVFFTTHGGSFWSTEFAAKAMVAAKYPTCLSIKGKAAHASRSPHQGRSALDAAMLTGMGIEFLREHVLETDRMHYAILSGGEAANVVPESAKMDLILRANDSNELNLLMARLDDIIHGAELMTHTKAEYKWDTPLLAPKKAFALYHFTKEAGIALGLPNTAFIANLPADVSTDAGNIAYQKPLAFITFPASEKDTPPLHTDEFAEAAATDYAISNGILAGKMMALAAMRLYDSPEALADILSDFNKKQPLEEIACLKMSL
jgi:amidohydrolase